jgi:hypothetical protein
MFGIVREPKYDLDCRSSEFEAGDDVVAAAATGAGVETGGVVVVAAGVAAVAAGVVLIDA